jgi:hypothetical protein
MMSFQLARVWKTTLEPQIGADHYEEPRRRLREAFLRFRAKAAVLASEIGRDLPSRTVHDITHLDALWGIADVIAGQDLVLTPTEAFVLGGAFLVHDLAMSRASYPNGLDSIRKNPTWRDNIVALLRTRLGRTPLAGEIESPAADIEDRATEETIIASHALQAEQLPVVAWTTKDTNDQFFVT